MNYYKNINITKVASILAVSALLSTTAYAGNDDSMIALGAKIGTAGVGIEGRAPIADNLYGRFGVNYLHYNHSLEGPCGRRPKNVDLDFRVVVEHQFARFLPLNIYIMLF